ncbi:20926_t:CDS:2, partial [Gigaspora margarita]
MDQTELQSPEVNTRKINLGTIKIQLLGVIGTDLHVIEITGELPEQHTDRFIEETHTIEEMKQTIIMIYFIKEKTPLQERLEGYLEQERKNYPKLDQYIKNKEWDNQQYDLSSLSSNIYKYTNTEINNSLNQPRKDKKNYPREQFEETEENITDLMIKENDNYELSDLKAKTGQLSTKEEIEKLTNEKMHQNPLNLKNTFNTKRQSLENKLFQESPTTSRIFGRKNIQWKDTTIQNEISISEQAEKYKKLREKINNIFDKPSKEEILKTLNQDPFTSKLTSTYVQPLTRYEVKLTKTKLPFNKPNELTNISLFNGPLFNQLTLMEHLEESLYIRIAANKKNQSTEGQYQDWQQQMFQKIEKQYNILYNEGKQFLLKNIMQNQIKEEYDNLHEMLNHDQLKLNFIAIDRAIEVGKTTTCHWLKTWLQSYEQN